MFLDLPDNIPLPARARSQQDSTSQRRSLLQMRQISDYIQTPLTSSGVPFDAWGGMAKSVMNQVRNLD